MKKLMISFGVCVASAIFVQSIGFCGEPLDMAKITKPPEIGAELTLPIARQTLRFSEQNGRIFYIPIALNGKTSFRFAIAGGADNSMDGGMTWRVMDSTLKTTLKSGQARTKKRIGWTVTGIRSSTVVLVLEDKDTKFTGKSPGNDFDILVNPSK